MRLRGSFAPPGDKSISHRVALLSLLARGVCEVRNYSTAQDCMTSVRSVKLLGGSVGFSGGKLKLVGSNLRLVDRADIDCQNSGTTMRLLMGILAGSKGPYVLTGDDSLMKRPMERIAKPLVEMGARICCNERGTPPVKVTGGDLVGIDYLMPVASAQLKSAILIAGLQADGVTRVTEQVKSRDHTELMLRQFGGDIFLEDGAWVVRKSDLELPEFFDVPGDPSSAAFIICAAAMLPGSDIVAERILLNVTRSKFLDKLTSMGAEIKVEPQGDYPEPWGAVRCVYSQRLSACEVTADELPQLIDEIPILALLATQSDGVSVFHQIGELRIKESDRVAALVSELGKMGARLEIQDDDLVIFGPTPLKPAGDLQSFGDHRIAMTLSIACMIANTAINVEDIGCIAVSFPNFLTILGELRQ
jgi:3-phosphoshikimate 1-carboxyvinyltransferase